MPEKKMLQLTLDERDAEMLAGAMAIAACVVTAGKIGGAIMETIKGEIQAEAVLIMKEGSHLGCAVSEFYGLPCPEHHDKMASPRVAIEGRKDAVERASRIADILHDFSHEYRDGKIEAFPASEPGGDWKPTLFSN